jgi:hypothetical protein
VPTKTTPAQRRRSIRNDDLHNFDSIGRETL